MCAIFVVEIFPSGTEHAKNPQNPNSGLQRYYSLRRTWDPVSYRLGGEGYHNVFRGEVEEISCRLEIMKGVKQNIDFQ